MAGQTPLVVIGVGGFGREVFQLVRDINAAAPQFDVLGFLDDDVQLAFLERLGAPLLGPTSLLPGLGASFVIAIGSPDTRRRIDERLRSSAPAATLMHPLATVGSDVQVGGGGVIGAGARLTTNVSLGRHVHVNVNCTIGHDVVVEDYTTLYPGVHLGGGCVIEEGALLGTGCVILPRVRIGRGAIVGAGAVVARDVLPGTTVVTATARPTLRSTATENGAVPD